jgi:RNA polymerase sigma-70 factor (ECF subfamily)
VPVSVESDEGQSGGESPGRPPDEDLLERIRKGDESAMDLFLRRHRSDLAGHVRRLLTPDLRRRVSVDDVVQEACLAAFRRLPELEFRGDGPLRAWLRKIAELKVKAAVQRHAGTAKRDAGREVSRGGRPDTAHFPGPGRSPSEHAASAELAERVGEAMESLPEDYREVLRLAFEERLPLRLVAERMGRSREAVKKLYGRALARFTRRYGATKDSRHE